MLSWMMAMMLDATAGNRHMWPNKTPPNVVFIDKEFGLAIPPDIFADNHHCPFRDGVFDCIFYDPPYSVHQVIWFMNKQTRKHGGLGYYYGKFDSKTDLFSSVHKAQKEFQRLTNRLCFKWNEYQVSIWKILPFFKGWTIKQIKEHKSKWQRGKDKTYWITFVRSCT